MPIHKVQYFDISSQSGILIWATNSRPRSERSISGVPHQKNEPIIVVQKFYCKRKSQTIWMLMEATCIYLFLILVNKGLYLACDSTGYFVFQGEEVNILGVIVVLVDCLLS